MNGDYFHFKNQSLIVKIFFGKLENIPCEEVSNLRRKSLPYDFFSLGECFALSQLNIQEEFNMNSIKTQTALDKSFSM